MSTEVKDVKIDSANDYATAVIIISRGYVHRQPKASDLPADVRQALLEWLGIDAESRT